MIMSLKSRTSALVGALVLSLSLVALSVPTPGYAFGTIRELGQDIEHGRITRRALACQADSAFGTCFETKTLNSLAGKKGTFGAVGAPDRGRGMLTSYAHCSGGDYYDVQGYPHSKAQAEATITECRDHMIENLNHAVRDAAKLVTRKNKIKSREVSMSFDCVYKGSKHGRAKCNILAHMGRILHASQDFYSHSNWVDLPDIARPVDLENPPGLGYRGASPWLNLRIQNPVFPDGLISGCFDNASFLGEESGCMYGEAGAHRVRHLNVNKDTGVIDPVIDGGKTERGQINDNFKHAVEAAIADSTDKWATYRERLVQEYGQERAQIMICVLTHDNAVKNCSK
jgi:hypothetical protein